MKNVKDIVDGLSKEEKRLLESEFDGLFEGIIKDSLQREDEAINRKKTLKENQQKLNVIIEKIKKDLNTLNENWNIIVESAKEMEAKSILNSIPDENFYKA